MALSVLSRPQSCRLSDTANTTYSIANDGSGDAVLTGGAGLSHLDRIYIADTYESYNGFWTVVVAGPTTFIVRVVAGVGNQAAPYTNDVANVKIYTCAATVKWSCAHLPIQYALQSSLFPNTADALVAVTGFA